MSGILIDQRAQCEVVQIVIQSCVLLTWILCIDFSFSSFSLCFPDAKHAVCSHGKAASLVSN
jgi:hypothetical protein